VRTGFYWGKLRERGLVEDPGVDENVILRWIFKSGLNCSGSEQGQMVGYCECGNEHSGSIKCGEFLD
jgi:hypothetical protein